MVPGDFSVRLINTGLAEQFVIHMKVSLYAGLLCASPYVIYLLFRFVSPALYDNERRYAVRTVGAGYVMFLLGTALNYFLIFPLTFRFLGTYQVSAEVENTVTLQSYMDTLLMMSLTLGIVFEIPVLCWLLARFGVLTSSFMRRFRRHAVVVVLVAAAVITPTSDVFTLLLVAFPMWLLYEAGIWVVAATEKGERAGLACGRGRWRCRIARKAGLQKHRHSPARTCQGCRAGLCLFHAGTVGSARGGASLHDEPRVQQVFLVVAQGRFLIRLVDVFSGGPGNGMSGCRVPLHGGGRSAGRCRLLLRPRYRFSANFRTR